MSVWDVGGLHICTRVCTLYLPWDSLHCYLSCNRIQCMVLGTYSCLYMCSIVISFNYILWAHHVRSCGDPVGAPIIVEGCVVCPAEVPQIVPPVWFACASPSSSCLCCSYRHYLLSTLWMHSTTAFWQTTCVTMVQGP